jgi:hypothetical protein
MSRKSGNIVKHTAAELRAMNKRGAVKTDWKAAAKKPLPSGRDADDAMEEIDWLTTELPQPRHKAPMTLRLDPARQAIVLVGGNKTGKNQARFYRDLIKLADRRLAAHIARRKTKS